MVGVWSFVLGILVLGIRRWMKFKDRDERLPLYYWDPFRELWTIPNLLLRVVLSTTLGGVLP